MYDLRAEPTNVSESSFEMKEPIINPVSSATVYDTSRSWAAKISKESRSRFGSSYFSENGHSMVALSPLDKVQQDCPERCKTQSSTRHVLETKSRSATSWNGMRTKKLSFQSSSTPTVLLAEAAAKEVANTDFPSLQSAVLAEKLR